MSKVYELYHCEYQGEVVYIGQGARGRHQMEGLCPSCYGDIIYYKKDWSDFKANPIDLTFKVYFKGDENEF